MNRIFFALLVFSVFTSTAQKEACGTRITQKQLAVLKDFHPAEKSTSSFRQAEAEPRPVGITAHLIHQTDGSGGLAEPQLADAINNLNDFYATANLFFFVAKINHINNSEYFNFNTADEVTLGTAFDVKNTINIYFANTVSDDFGAYCGYAYFPGGPDRILMNNSCAINESTLPHEMGHYFTLHHTHGSSNSSLTDELVDGSNCSFAGDEICDTPADPQLSNSNVTLSCVYTGSETDANGDPFQPDPTNLMSYSRKECRDHFTQQQYTRIDAAYPEYRSYLIKKKVVADFLAEATEVCAGAAVAFEDRSLNAVSWTWTFSGGTPASSTESSPTVTYGTPGVYHVELIISGGTGGSDTLFMENHIRVIDPSGFTLIADEASFENDTLDEKVINPDGGLTFSLTSGAAKKGSKSVRMNFYEYERVGEVDYLALSYLDNDFSSKYLLTFDYAYAIYDNTYSDGLEIVYRAACEKEWQTLWSKNGTGLATTTPKSAAFVPTASQWKNIVLEFDVPDSVETFELAFKAINGYGNNLYLDEVQLSATFDAVNENVSCHAAVDGRVRASLPNSSAYTFSLDGVLFTADSVFTDLGPGLYTVYVKDVQNRVVSRAVTVTEPNPVALVVTATDISCNGETDGSVELNATGGSGSFTYKMNGDTLPANEVSDLALGTYSFTAIDQNGCAVSSLEVQINEPAAVSVAMVVTNPTCFGGTGSVMVNANGGSGSFVYRLSGMDFQSDSLFDGLAADMHELVVRDASGCDTTLTFEITQPDSLFVIATVADELCLGDASGIIELAAFGGTGDYSYYLDGTLLDSPVVEGLDHGLYEIQVMDDNGCTALQVAPVGFLYEYPEIPVIVQAEGMLSIPSTSLQIRWYRDGELLGTENSNTIPYAAGQYQVSLSHEGACEVFSELAIVLSVADQIRSELVVYPNPASEHFRILLPEVLSNKVEEVTVFDLSGSKLMTTTLLNMQVQWPAGTYLLRLKGNGFVVDSRLIIQ